MSKSVIKVQNLSKRYRIGLKEKKADTLVDQVLQAIKSPWANLKKLNNLNQFGEEDESVFWALKDISFEVKQGEVLGIIGKNGAGKSTLLKILSQITEPTSGKIEIHGRVASLLEVGTGFHPELSGRDNIYMNGTILGMTRREIDSKLDEIIDFSGVGKFIDTPVKHYSSGMKVRLGFSVAAHLEPEILIIDEVLAVGDFEFQKKCLGKMEDVSKNQGRTVLFVTHDLSAISRICTNLIILEESKVKYNGGINSGINYYISEFANKVKHNWKGSSGDDLIKVLYSEIESSGSRFSIDCELKILLKIKFLKNIDSLVIGLNILNELDFSIIRLNYNDYGNFSPFSIGEYSVEFFIPKETLAVGLYKIRFDVSIPFVRKIIDDSPNLVFEMVSFSDIGDAFKVRNSNNYNSIVRPNWLNKIIKINE